MRNSIVEGLGERKLDEMQLDTFAIVFKVIDVMRDIRSRE